MQWLSFWDHQLLLGIAAHLRADWLTPILYVLTTINNHGEIWLLLALICLLRPNTRRCGAAMLTALVFGLLVGNVGLKPLVARPRPFQTYTDLTTLIPPPGGFSFPSGHTLSSFTAATACFYFFRRPGVACYVLACLIAFSRLYFCVHYPTDVLCGAILGVVLGVLAARLTDWTADSIRFARIKR